MRNRALDRAWSDDTGATAVEFAILAPVFITIMIAALGFSLAMFTISSLHYAVEEAARCASVKTTVCTDAASIQAYAQSHYSGIGASPTFTYTAAACGKSVTGTVTYVLDSGLYRTSIPFSASACFP